MSKPLPSSPKSDSRFTLKNGFLESSEAGPSEPKPRLELTDESEGDGQGEDSDRVESGRSETGSDEDEDMGGMDPEGFAGPIEEVVKPLTPEALAAFKATQERAGVVYISRIPPGMRPTKVRHLLCGYGEIGRVYLQQEDAKRAYLRKKYTSTKKAHFTEGWVEFKDKRVARSVAEMLNAQPIGGKKGTRWRDDVWTMKYLPRFKWNMLTEQIAHEAAVHTARLRVELTQSRKEQHDYLRQVELARVLDKRVAKKRKVAEEKGETFDDAKALPNESKRRRLEQGEQGNKRIKQSKESSGLQDTRQLESVLGSVF